MPVPKRKVTIYLDPSVESATRSRAARYNKRNSEIVEEALRMYLWLTESDEARIAAGLGPEESAGG